jgi:hypothetical protein
VGVWVGWQGEGATGEGVLGRDEETSLTGERGWSLGEGFTSRRIEALGCGVRHPSSSLPIVYSNLDVVIGDVSCL